MAENGTTAITDVLGGIETAGEEAGEGERVSVEQIVERMGDRSFAPLLLVPALIVVSPISGVPGVPTMGAAIIGLIAAQMLLGRERLWLPRFLLRRSVSARRLTQATTFLRRPVGWVEPLLRQRLTFLAQRPGSFFAVLTCLLITFVMPPMEVLPMLGSLAATAISLLAAGLLVRDGLLVLLGYAMVIAGGGLAWYLVSNAG